MSELVFGDVKEETKMVRPPCFDSNGMKKGAWSKEEDNILRAHIERFGHPNWRLLPLLAGLARCGKSCRLRWVNYLQPGLRREKFTKHEEDLIIKLHHQLGNKWSAIAEKFPGRTDNEIKNYWHAHINKRGKRNGTVRRKAIIAEMPDEEQSSDQINYSITTGDDHHQDESASDQNVSPQGLSATNPENIDALNNPINTDPYLVAQAHQSDLWINEPYDETYLPPIFLEEDQFYDFGLCKNDMSSFSDSSSDGGITCSNSTTAESELGNYIWCETLGEEDTFDMVLW